MKRGLRALGWLAGIAATAGSIYYIGISWKGQDLAQYASPAALAGLATGILFYVIGVLVSALAWRKLLAGVGLKNRWGQLAGIVSITQIAKYLPGNVAQHVGRASLCFSRGIGPAPFFVTAGIELALLLPASALIGTGALLASGRSIGSVTLGKGEVVVAISALAVAAVALVVVMRRAGPMLLARFAPRLADRFTATALPPSSALLQAFLLYCLVYVAFGGGIVAMAALITTGIEQHGWLLVAAFSLAWIVGFVTPGAPAGVGVREGVMLLIMGTAYPPAAAAAIVVALRLATTLGDVLLLPLGWALLRTGSSADSTTDQGNT